MVQEKAQKMAQCKIIEINSVAGRISCDCGWIGKLPDKEFHQWAAVDRLMDDWLRHYEGKNGKPF